MYYNWQLSSKGILLLVYTVGEKEEEFISTLCKYDPVASLIIGLLCSGYAKESIPDYFKAKGYKISSKLEKSINDFVSHIVSAPFYVAIQSEKECIINSFKVPDTFVSPRHLRAPRILLQRTFKGFACERWSKNLGKHASYEQFKYPFKVNFDITRNCNLDCGYCYLDDAGPAEDLPIEKIKLIIDGLSECNIKMVNLFGGEPFLRKDIFDIIEYIRNKSMQVVINTNGTLMDDYVVRRLKALGVSALHVSLDANCQSKLTEMRGDVSFELLTANIRRTVLAGLNVQINCTVSRKNIWSLPGMLRLAERIGVHTLSIGPFHSIGKGRDNSRAFAMNNLMYFIGVSLFRIVFSGSKTRIYVKEHCDANSYFHIDHTGSFHYCSQMPRNMPFGNILHQKPMDIWRSAAYKRLFDPGFIKDPCGSCVFRYIYCNRWRCRAELAAGDRDILAGDPDCARGRLSMLVLRMFS